MDMFGLAKGSGDVSNFTSQLWLQKPYLQEACTFN